MHTTPAELSAVRMTAPDDFIEVFDDKPSEPLRLSRLNPPRSVDFAHVPPSQWEMHDRLVNWGRSLTNRPSREVSSGFSLFQSSDAREERRPYGGETSPPLDIKDAQRIAMAVAAVAQDKRNDGFRRSMALDWYYRLGCKHARAKADEMCLSMQGLADTVIAARLALIEWDLTHPDGES